MTLALGIVGLGVFLMLGAWLWLLVELERQRYDERQDEAKRFLDEIERIAAASKDGLK